MLTMDHTINNKSQILFKKDLAASSISEGAQIFPLAQYRGVDIWVCDESSLMATGTYFGPVGIYDSLSWLQDLFSVTCACPLNRRQ